MKKTKITLSVLLLIITIASSHSQPGDGIFEGDVTLTTQAEVDAFSYTEVAGILTISGNDISNLSSLSQLTKVYGLSISGNPNLHYIDGLSALSQVLGDITIMDNPVLSNLDALSSIIEARQITIHNNPLLESINGFSTLSGSIYGLTISSNAELKSFNGFKNVKSLSSYDGGRLVIDNNASLPDVDGLTSLNAIWGKSGDIQITNNSSLLNIDGLSAFYSMSNTSTSINISNNAALKNINGLSSLSVMGTDNFETIRIENNAALEDIDGLSALRAPFGFFSPYSEIRITNNPSLTRCEGLQPLIISMGSEVISQLISIGNVDVSANGAGCTIEDIIAGIPLSVTGFSIINALTGDQLYSSADSMTIDENNPYYAIGAIGAKTFPSTVGSVVFILSNQKEIVDNDYPFALGLTTLGVGSHSVTAEPYSQPDKQGEKGIGKSFVINILGAPQTCEGDVVLTSQAQVDAFNCSEVTGTLTISGDDISNLNALSGLTRVGKLIIEGNQNLANVNGLSSLSHAGDFYEGFNPSPFVNISNNQALTDLNGLSSLHEVGGPIIIDNNDLLETINGFTSLPLIGHTLQISNNDRLQSISGFSGVTAINSFFDSQLIIDNNASLTNVDGLSSLRSLRGKGAYLQIINNASLLNLDGLMSLASLNATATEVNISNNDALINLNGLSSLRNVGLDQLGSIIIQDNALLENIDGLSHITTPFGQNSQNPTIIIVQNPSLSECNGIYPLLVSLGFEAVIEQIELGSIIIADNGPGCTIDDILANNPQTISIFSLINIRTGFTMNSFNRDTVTLDIVDPHFADWGILANTFPTIVGSVEFVLNNKTRRTDNTSPYIFDLPKLNPGIYNVKTDVYSKAHKKGVKGVGKTATIIVKNSAAIESYELVDATGRFIKPLNEGEEINTNDADFSASVNIRANVSDHNITSVRFFLNGVFIRTDTSYPFSFNNDDNGNYYPWNPQPGDYTLLAVPSVVRGHKEYVGKSLEIQFTVEGQEGAIAIAGDNRNEERFIRNKNAGGISLYPVPVDTELYVKMEEEAGKNAVLTIVNIQGLTVYKDSYSTSKSINTAQFRPGVYFLVLTDDNGFRKMAKFIKQ